MRIGIVARLKQGDLLDALTSRGWNQTDGARFLGISPTTFGHLINMTDVPQTFTAEMTIKLFELTGKTTEELFPSLIRSEEFRTKNKTRRITFEADPSYMLGQKEMFQLEAPPEMTPQGILGIKEMRETIAEVLKMTLSPKEEKILRAHMFDKIPFEELDEQYGWTKGYSRHVVAKALRKLRGPESARRLRGILT